MLAHSHIHTQERLREVELTLAQSSGELELARGARSALEQRLMGAKTRAEVGGGGRTARRFLHVQVHV